MDRSVLVAKGIFGTAAEIQTIPLYDRSGMVYEDVFDAGRMAPGVARL